MSTKITPIERIFWKVLKREMTNEERQILLCEPPREGAIPNKNGPKKTDSNSAER
jgi:hypothetical protein